MTEKELYKYRATHKQSRKNLIALIWIVLALTSFMFSILFSDPASMLPLIVLAIAVIIITVSLIFIFLL
jgi:fatty acid desaturase